jgi:hypothetical protein
VNRGRRVARRGGVARHRAASGLALLLVLLVAVSLRSWVTPARAQTGGALIAEPVRPGTIHGLNRLLDASPAAAPGEVWGVGENGSFLKYTNEAGWVPVEPPIGLDGQPLSGGTGSWTIPESTLAARATATGGLAIAAEVKNGASPEIEDTLLIGDPGARLREIPAPEKKLLLSPQESFLGEYESETKTEAEKEAFFKLVGERLFGSEGAAAEVKGAAEDKLVAIEEADGTTGALVVPVARGIAPQDGVLHFADGEWKREPICLNVAPKPCEPPTAAAGTFKVLAIEATGPGNAWLLAEDSSKKTGGVKLFAREGDGSWRPRPLGGTIGAFFSTRTAPGTTVSVGLRTHSIENGGVTLPGQPLTVTSEGVWIDLRLTPTSGEPADATIFYNIDSGTVTGSWCELPELPVEMCASPLGSDLQSGGGRSFAWPSAGGSSEPFGRRTVTGIGRGAILTLEGTSMVHVPLAGQGGAARGAALTAPDEGWLGPNFRLSRTTVPAGLASWPVPFRHPLTAIAAAPEEAVASLGSQALAVGVNGQVARYQPNIGWQPESLLSSSGARATPLLRGVAWPRPSTAYAVGDEGAMWLWRKNTGLWEPDPGSPPNLVRGNFTGIAFEPGEPTVGYAIGKQGLLLGYGRRWTQEPLPPELPPEANFTSIAFAGDEALVTYQVAGGEPGQVHFSGGLLVNDGAGWHIETAADEVLGQAEGPETPIVRGPVPRRVAGLADGGAVVAGIEGNVIERDGSGQPWHLVPGNPGYPAALVAVREAGQVRAIGSFAGANTTAQQELSTDEVQALFNPVPGQPPLLTPAYQLPGEGTLTRQTATGWRSEEPEVQIEVPSGKSVDLPRRPEPIFALLGDGEGNGWAVGGESAQGLPLVSGVNKEAEELALQTASVMRFGASASPPQNFSGSPLVVPAGEATFAVGGGAQCAEACADLSNVGIGPDVWLRSAVARAASIPELRAFLYTGDSVANGAASETTHSGFGLEEGAYAARLGLNAGAMPVYAAPAASDIDRSGTLGTFLSRFSGFAKPLGAGAPGAGILPLAEETAAGFGYSFDSTGNGGTVRVIVLDYTAAPLPPERQCWLAQQLAAAKAAGAPAIVLGNQAAEPAMAPILVTGQLSGCVEPAAAGGASAYLYEAALGKNSVGTITSGAASIPAFGSGSLGYHQIPVNVGRAIFAPASGFLLVSVETAKSVNNVAPVTANLIPSIEDLSLDATEGTLLRRSRPALFRALARRPRAGLRCSSEGGCQGDPYLQIPPEGCFGGCPRGEIAPAYRFSSSNPDIANFVEVDPASESQHAVFLDEKGETVPDPSSGLLCAYNAGATTVTVEAGGLSYSTNVTVQSGSVEQPCGTVPLANPPAPEKAIPAPELPPAPFESPNFTQPSKTLPSPSPPPAPTPNPTPTPSPPPAQPSPVTPLPAKLPKSPAPPVIPFFSPSPALSPLVVVLPPPPPPAVEPTPPTGTSPVTQPAVSPEPQEEEEAAIEQAHQMVAYAPGQWRRTAFVAGPGHSGAAPYYAIPLLVLVMAGAVTGIGRRRRRTSPALAGETNKTMRRYR